MERLGVERSREALERAELILAVTDGAGAFTQEDREALERDFAATTNVREMDVMAAQRTILLKAEEAKKCM